ncbi:ComEC/Rec2 family competence protein [Terasakiella sp. A23]|uniref:ComEC/Rec2 family competence protein n=1 Tax=Terasakiella sp. FCG-A23 TaxID=3080561 RepID=UPI002954C3EA|nr:ComEC/Rec2 family competence protein [Terasakiella sp. A23]
MLSKNRHKSLSHYKQKLFDESRTQEKDHFFLAIPLLLGAGIAVYFGMTTEPPVWTGLTLLFISGVTTYYLRNYYIVFLSTLALTIVFAGFSSAQLRTTYLSTIILPNSFGPAGIQGRIVSVTPTQKGTKILLEDLQISRLRADHVPTRLRLHVNSLQTQVNEGQWIETRGMLKPPPQPAYPGAFDFQRHAYFQQIGAVGFAYGDIKIISATDSDRLTFFGNLRQTIQARIEKTFNQAGQDDQRTLAIAFLTGNKQVINEATHETVRAAGLAHLLAISGLHIGLVSAIAFLSIRSFLSLIPAIALNYPIKKIAAFLAIFAALFFTLLTGGSTPTIRAFVMTSIVLVGILLDRKAMSLRTVSWAAILILVSFPESLLSASFQLSFAAVTALVAFYEKKQTDFSQPNPIRYLKDVFKSSLIASLATTPFAAFHFNRIALYGIGSNLLAIPITVFWIMPFGLLSLALMPLGLEFLSLSVMGWGIESLLWVAKTTADIPFSQISVPRMGTNALIFITIGGLITSIYPGYIRKFGICIIGVGVINASMIPKPDVLINSNGKLTAIKSETGETFISDVRYAAYTRESWQRSWGQEEKQLSPFKTNLPCDKAGCQYVHQSGYSVSVNQNSLALNEDCQKADILITTFNSPSICKRPLHIIDAHALKQQGAHAIYINSDEIKIETVKGVRGTRPWANYGQ